MRFNFSILLFLTLISISGCLYAQTIYVSPVGNDKNSGTKERPVCSFERAQQIARKFDKDQAVEVIFAKGIYYLPNTIQFTALDSRPANAPIIYKSETEGAAIISGGSRLNLKWKIYKNGIYVANILGDQTIDQLYINNVRQRMARFPNAVEGKNVYDKWNLAKDRDWASHESSDEYNPSDNPISLKRISSWKNPNGGFIHTMHEALWGDMHWEITGKKNDSTLIFEGGWQNNRPSGMHKQFQMVENIFEELDAPGEWFYDSKSHKLYYMPTASLNLKNAVVEIVRLKNLIEFNGTKPEPVSNVNLQGFVFRHAARTFMENKEPLGRSDWTIYRGGAVFYNGATNCSLAECEFDQVGGNTVFVNNYNRNVKISGCYIHNSGASGVVFVGDQNAVRSYLVGYVNQNYKQLDSIHGPANDNFPMDCVVENCLITKTGRDEKQTAGVQISMSKGIRIIHCSIYDLPRAGININEGTFGGHIIENCDVFNTVLETGDHGSFNSWGRDRFWTPDVAETASQVSLRPSLPLWDMPEPIIIRNSRWKCNYGWDIDLDDGSSNYRIYNNLLLNRGLKLREGYNRIVKNNIMINNGLHPHVWYPNSGDVFTSNIVFKAHQPAAMNRAISNTGKWGEKVDSNFYVCSKAEMNKFNENDCDFNSQNGDPEFVNPSTFNFNVKTGSPATKIGFVNFPMDSYGVTSTRLKKIAKTPDMPSLKMNIELAIQIVQKTTLWLGATLTEPTGDELSAFGANYADGGVALSNVPENSEAAKNGFKTGDLIQKINDMQIMNLNDFMPWIEKKDQTHFKVSMLRNQTKEVINF